jgi:hypothetical protein
MDTTTIARSETGCGFGIAILHNTRSGVYHVARYGTRGVVANKYVVISNHATETEARAAGNRHWLAERAS